MRSRGVIISILASIALQFAATAQNVTEQTLLWSGYFNKCSIAEKWQIHTEYEERRYLFPDRVHQRFMPRLSVLYTVSDRFALNAGCLYFQQWLPHDPEIDAYLSNEIRPHQYAQFTEQYGRVQLITRIMFEERFMQRDRNSFMPYRFNLRERTLFRAAIKLIGNFTGHESSKIDLFAYDEFFVHMGEGIGYNVFDQNHIGAGLMFKFNDTFSLQGSYFNWYQQRPSGVDFFSRHIIHFTLFHKM